MNQLVLTVFLGVLGSGLALRPHSPCRSEPVTITTTVCKIEYDKDCTSEVKEVGDRVTYERGDCKEVEVCKPPGIFIPRRGGFLKRREANPDADYFDDIECEKETKEICKRVPVKTPVEREVKTCVRTPKEVCEEKEREAPQITCEEIVPSEDEEDDDIYDDLEYFARFG